MVHHCLNFHQTAWRGSSQPTWPISPDSLLEEGQQLSCRQKRRLRRHTHYHKRRKERDQVKRGADNLQQPESLVSVVPSATSEVPGDWESGHDQSLLYCKLADGGGYVPTVILPALWGVIQCCDTVGWVI